MSRKSKMSQEKKNLFFFPLGTIGRDAVYALFTNYILLYIMYTRNLTTAQLSAVTAIMVAARVFDALNDPVMGNIIERTRSRFGKFKPWLLAGVLSTSVVIYLAFNTDLQGWNFIIFFGIIYFMYSITFTMHDISYWGMIPALSSDGDARNRFTSRAAFCAGIGGTLVSVLTPMLTTGENAIGGNAKTAYGTLALLVAVLAPIIICTTLFGTKENRDDMNTAAPKISFKKIVTTIGHNDQLICIAIAFLLQQIGNGIVLGGVGSNYIYFEFGYDGSLYTLFNMFGMAMTAILMVCYPAISRKIKRQSLVRIMWIIAIIGYALMLGVGIILPANDLKFWMITIGFMMANFGQYGLYLIMMISIINTVEYNEYRNGTRDEAIITSMRPFLTKLASSLTVIITTVTYIICRVTDVTNRISDIETMSEQGLVSAEEKISSISAVIGSVEKVQSVGLLLSMTLIPALLMLASCFIYRRHYKLDEERYDEICAELARRKN